jgi:hypothetical protein
VLLRAASYLKETVAEGCDEVLSDPEAGFLCEDAMPLSSPSADLSSICMCI